jgi:hypothetical protein
MAALLLAAGLAGCSTESYMWPDELPYDKLAAPYNYTALKASTTLDVLNVAQDPEHQLARKDVEAVLLTQGDTVVGYSGRSKDGQKTWLNVVVFDEFRMTAKRKYFVYVDERAQTAPGHELWYLPWYLFPPRAGVLFDSQFTVDPEILTTPYATEEAQRIALVRWLAGQFANDLAALMGGPKNPTQGNKFILTSGMMVRQVFQGILVELDKSPDLAKNLSDEQGVEFPHMSLKSGRIRMLVDNDVATATIRVNLPMVPPPQR